MYPIKNIIRTVTRSSEDSLKIITFCESEEKYVHALSKTPHQFYLWNENIDSSWNTLVEDQPSNVFSLPSVSANIYDSYFDLVICHNRIEQYNIASAISHALHIPLIIVDHCGEKTLKPSPIFSNVTTEDINKLYTHDFIINVCTHDKLVSEWPHPSKGSVAINNGVDLDKYRPLNIDKEFSIILDNYIPQPVAQFLNPLNKYRIISTDIEDRDEIYNRGNVFINTWKDVNIKLLEAMACGTVPICIESPEIKNFIQNEKTGFIVKDVQHMTSVIDKIQNNEINTEEISKNAREYVAKHHDIKTFVHKWQQVFQLVHNSFYHRGIK